MATNDDVNTLSSNLRAMTVKEDDINILLLGETGIGKSTFINSFTNYLHYNTLDLAEKNGLKCLISGKFEISLEKDGKMERHTISIASSAEDTNENTNIFTAATQGVRSYVFPVPDINNRQVRIIDTPGICDDRGIEQDKQNLENILSYLGRIEMLHGICILLKPNNARLTPAFEYCITQLLSRLEKSAGDIITFVYTNSRGSSYKPQDTSTAINHLLTKIAKNPPHVTIKYDISNIFCLDNESFRYLAAKKQNVDMGDRNLMKQSWDKSTSECHRIIKYLTGEGYQKPTPHQVSRTISVNKARQAIMELSKPLADITELINDNLVVLQTHQKSIKQDTQSLDELKAKLYVPVVGLEEIECPQPKTVCHNVKCCETIVVESISKLHYKQRCHDPCYLTNVTREIVGDSGLKHCAAMDGAGKCKRCGCDFSAHLHIYYETRTVNTKIEGAGIRTQINDMKTGLKVKEDTIRDIEKEMNEYEQEKKIIIKSMAKFAHFLKQNAITPFNDAYKNYIQILIARENSRGPECNLQQVQSLKSMLNQYDEEKRILQDALKERVHGYLKPDEITPDLVIKEVKNLFALKKMGSKIRNMYDMQKKGEAIEHKKTELVLPDSGILGFAKKIPQPARARGSNKINMIHEDNKFKNNKKGGQEKYSKQKIQNMGQKYQEQQNNPNKNRNQPNQRSNQQRNSNSNNRGQNQNRFPNQQYPNIPPLIPPLIPPNQYPNYFQGHPMNYQMPPQPFNYQPQQQFQYPNMPPNAYPNISPNPQWNYGPNQPPTPQNQPPNLYPHYHPTGYPPTNLQEHNQNIPMNNKMDNYNSPPQQKRKDSMKNNVDKCYDELYSTDNDQVTERSSKNYKKNDRDNRKMLNNEYNHSDSDNEGAAGFEKFRKQKGNENYRDLYGDDDDSDEQGSRMNKLTGLVSGFRNMFK